MRSMESARGPEYSLVVPVYNEEETLPELLRRLASLLERMDGECEVILVDDACRGTSGTRLPSPRASTRPPAMP